MSRAIPESGSRETPMTAEAQKPSLVAVARIARPRGLRGEVVADVLTDFPERFEGLENVTAVLANQRRSLKIEEFRFQGGRLVLKFENIDSIEAAEALRDAEVCVDEADAVTLETDEFFDWQLEGCGVETVDSVLLGTVKSVMRTGGTEILVVAAADGKELLIPFAESICTEVDIAAKVIRVDPPEGLLEL